MRGGEWFLLGWFSGGFVGAIDLADEYLDEAVRRLSDYQPTLDHNDDGVARVLGSSLRPQIREVLLRLVGQRGRWRLFQPEPGRGPLGRVPRLDNVTLNEVRNQLNV